MDIDLDQTRGFASITFTFTSTEGSRARSALPALICKHDQIYSAGSPLA